MLISSFFILSGLVATLLSGLFLLLRLRWALNLPNPPTRTAGSPTRIAIVLGSGGHTAELLSSLQSLPTSRYTHRSYIVSSGDSFSASKAAAFEQRLSGLAELRRKPYGSYDVAVVPRARRVHQSALTAPWSCAQCWLACVRVLSTVPAGYQRQWQTYVSQRTGMNSKQRQQQQQQQQQQVLATPFPDLIITNGPATGLVVVLAAVFLRVMGIGMPRATDGGGGMRSLFVESWARVKSLSLTGRILVATGACQRVLVQWSALRDMVGGGVEYVGPVVR